MEEDLVQILKQDELSKYVFQFILKRNLLIRETTGIENPLFLAGINFWVAHRKDNEQVYLMYDTHKDEWDIEAIKKEIHRIEHEVYTVTGRPI